MLFIAGTSKQVYLSAFKGMLTAQRVVPTLMVPVVSRLVPLFEILLAALMVWNPVIFGRITLVTFVGFVLFRLLLRVKAKDVGCGCVGPHFGDNKNDLPNFIVTVLQLFFSVIIVLQFDERNLPSIYFRISLLVLMLVFLVIVFARGRAHERSKIKQTLQVAIVDADTVVAEGLAKEVSPIPGSL